MLGVSAHGFEEARNNGRGIDSFFGAGSAEAAAAVPTLARREEGGAKKRPLPALSVARNPFGFAVDSKAVVVEARVGAGEGDRRRRAAGEAMAFGGGSVADGARSEGQGGDGVGCPEEVVEVEARLADAGEAEAVAAGAGGDAVEGVVEDRSRSESLEEEEEDGLADCKRGRGGRSGASEVVVDLTTARGGSVLGVEERDRRRCDAEGKHETIVERDESLALRQRRGGGGGGAGLRGDGDDGRGRLHGTNCRESGACGADGKEQDHYCYDKGDEQLGEGALARDPQMEAAARCGAGGGLEEGGGSGVEKREAPSKADGPRERAVFESGDASSLLGNVDPDVLAELPVEIRREIWMQQVIS